MKTAKSMLDTGRYLYTVFMCQQSIEKLLKAFYLQKFKKESPRSHNLVYLENLIELNSEKSTLELFGELTSYYLKGRYPSYKQKLSKLVNKEKANKIFLKSESVFL